MVHIPLGTHSFCSRFWRGLPVIQCSVSSRILEEGQQKQETGEKEGAGRKREASEEIYLHYNLLHTHDTMMCCFQ